MIEMLFKRLGIQGWIKMIRSVRLIGKRGCLQERWGVMNLQDKIYLSCPEWRPDEICHYAWCPGCRWFLRDYELDKDEQRHRCRRRT